MAEFVYVSCVPEEGAVSRYGSGSATRKNELIGARFDPKTKKLRFFPERIVAIPTAEFVRFRKEYRRAIASGALLQRSSSDYRKASEQTPDGDQSERNGKKAKKSSGGNG